MPVPVVSEDTDVYYYVCASFTDGVEYCGVAVVSVTAKVVETPKEEPEQPAETPEEKPIETPKEEPEQPAEMPEEKPTETSEDTKAGSAAGTVADNSEDNYPYEICYDPPLRKHVMGGDQVLVQYIGEKPHSCGTITLGGIETDDGVRGFVVSLHVVADKNNSEGFSRSDVVTWHYSNDRVDYKRFLGKVHTIPAMGQFANTESKMIGVDAAFVAYPSPYKGKCSSEVWEHEGKKYCFDAEGKRTDSVQPLKIRGIGNDVYNVIGSQSPQEGLDFVLRGSVSGIIEGNPMTTTEKILTGYSDVFMYQHTASLSSEVRGGDSGAPLFTVPDDNGNVRIIGIISGSAKLFDGTEEIIVFGSWDDITETLDLKPLD